jgi:hypothetical protein
MFVRVLGSISPLGLLLREVGPAHRSGFLPPKATGAPAPRVPP